MSASDRRRRRRVEPTSGSGFSRSQVGGGLLLNASRVNSRDSTSWYPTVLYRHNFAYLRGFSAYLWAFAYD
jgi:hypothetical protein